MRTINIEHRPTPPYINASRMAEHDARMDFLETLAILVGCTEVLHSGLPDGKRPDVLRCNVNLGLLFIGDAKHTESPGCVATQGRLLEYLKWLSAQVSKDGRTGIFGLCFGKRKHADGWVNIVLKLSREVGLMFTEYGIESFTPDMIVTWFLSKKNATKVVSLPRKRFLVGDDSEKHSLQLL